MFGFLKRNKINVINVNNLESLVGKVELIDIREPAEYKGGSIKTAKNIPMANLLSRPDKYLNKQKTYYIMCQTGARSGRTSRALAKQGFNIVNVSGGMRSYRGINRN